MFELLYTLKENVFFVSLKSKLKFTKDVPKESGPTVIGCRIGEEFQLRTSFSSCPQNEFVIICSLKFPGLVSSNLFIKLGTLFTSLLNF
jgi:hypothetical protein